MTNKKQVQKKSAPSHQNRTVVLIGGSGGMGKVFAHQFKETGHEVRICDKEDWDHIDQLLNGAHLVLVCVPIAVTLETIERLEGKLQKETILADITSIKVEPVRKMLEVHEGPVVGLHPMFGPTTTFFDNQTVIVCHGRFSSTYQWVLDWMSRLGAKLTATASEEHDKLMATVQALRHFTTFAYGVHLVEEYAHLNEIMEFSSPIYRLELGMVGRLFAQDPRLYADIIFSSSEGKKLIKRYCTHYNEMVDLLDKDDKDGFIRHFNEVADWFGDLGQKFLDESTYIIDRLIQHTKGKD